LADNVRYRRERVPIFDCYLVRLLIILHKANLAILLLHEENRIKRRLGRADKSFADIIF
jgi:hypothetical protein